MIYGEVRQRRRFLDEAIIASRRHQDDAKALGIVWRSTAEHQFNSSTEITKKRQKTGSEPRRIATHDGSVGNWFWSSLVVRRGRGFANVPKNPCYGGTSPKKGKWHLMGIGKTWKPENLG